MRFLHFLTVITVLLTTYPVVAEEPPLTPEERFLPGLTATPWLTYQNPQAQSVVMAGSWDDWAGRHPLTLKDGVWVLDMRPVKVRFGRHEFKFIVNDDWESGENRFLYVNEEHLLERPPGIIAKAAIDGRNDITVYFKRGVDEGANVTAWLEPEVELEGWRMLSNKETGFRQGCVVVGGSVTFAFDERTYGRKLDPTARVAVAGNFNGWDGSGRNARWQLRDDDNDDVWELTTQLPGLRPPPGEETLEFKFVVNGDQWLAPPQDAPNAVSDGKGNTNLLLDPEGGGATVLKIRTKAPLDLSKSYVVAVQGVYEKTVRRMASPEGVFNTFVSEKAMGVRLDREQAATTYRLFAPRASEVHLCLFDSPYHARYRPDFQWLEPEERYPMWKDPEDGVWEISLLGLDVGQYYAFNVDGPKGDGESFNPDAAIGDPYARAAAHAQNNPIVVDPGATNKWFSGWTDQGWIAPKIQDAVIYETHVRDLTMHPSSGVPEAQRGKYMGLIASEGTGTGLDHLREMGFNMIELLPVAEFNNGINDYNWGYATTYFFAPEASYGHDAVHGAPFYEFKNMVNQLHRRGFGVILDVVYNHVGSPNLFSMLDKKYYFRLNPDYTYSNFSGVGNDFRSESPMARKLIVDNILYWMTEHHVDGFRLDLAELIDLDTLWAIRDAARAVNPDVLLISEPWSFRGEHKYQLTGSGWSAWNNDFRYAAKDFVAGRGNRDGLKNCIFGSVDTWASDPLQPVNYVESHDDMALADELSTAPGHDGRLLIESDVKQNRLAATLIFTSLGIPMICEGQEFLRSKRGVHNSYDKGDVINALNWEDRKRPLAAEAMEYYRGLIHLRRSEEGAAFRVTERPPASYYRWLQPQNQHALGYIVNAPKIHKGNGFIVLLNASADPVAFDVPVPPGHWRVIGDGRQIVPAGIEGKPPVLGPRRANIRVPGISSVLLMDGF